MPEFDLGKTRKRIARDWSVPFSGVNVTASRIHGKRVNFCTNRHHDPIQDRNRGGQFYEAEELEVLLRYFPLGGTFVDIGANIGNHTLFFALFGHPRKIIPFEPNPLACELLLANVAVNDIGAVTDVSHIGCGLSDREGQGFGMQSRVRNLGGAKMLENQGDIVTHTGDALLAGTMPALIKIDVEGMEMQVLKGLDLTIGRAKPVLFVEVDRRSEKAFRDWLEKGHYKIERVFQRYAANRNYLLVPAG